MDRRRFIGGVALGLVAAPLAVDAQPAGRVYRIGYRSAQAVLLRADEVIQ